MPHFSDRESDLGKTQTGMFDENNASFRVQTASAVNITKSINRMRVSQRLFEIQNAQKAKGVKLSEIEDPLSAYGDFRGLLLADYKTALQTSFPESKLKQIKQETVDCCFENDEGQMSRKKSQERSKFANSAYLSTDALPKRPNTRP